MTRRRPPKADSQLEHARRRLDERHDLVVTVEELKNIARQISNGKSRPIPPDPGIGYTSNRVTHHLVTIKGKPVRVVYDKHRKTIVTVLP